MIIIPFINVSHFHGCGFYFLNTETVLKVGLCMIIILIELDFKVTVALKIMVQNYLSLFNNYVN